MLKFQFFTVQECTGNKGSSTIFGVYPHLQCHNYKCEIIDPILAQDKKIC